MKIITFTVPCYNSEAYMRKCLDSLLSASPSDDVDILIVDDGSSDGTGDIADMYQDRFPGIVRVIHQSNGGHGEGVNRGIENALGLYFKVVDSDDWLDPDALSHLLSRLRKTEKESAPPDAFVCNFVYEHAEDNTARAMRFRRVFPTGRAVDWSETGHFGMTQYMSMHALILRTEVLRECGVVLPRHTFYVDNFVAYLPLPHLRLIEYLDIDLYRYFIGRDDQSVTEASLIKRIDQQLFVNRKMIEAYDKEALRAFDPKLSRYMYGYIRALMAVGAAIPLLSGKPVDKEKSDEVWAVLRKTHPDWYPRIRYLSPVAFLMLPGSFGRAIGRTAYRIGRRILKVN